VGRCRRVETDPYKTETILKEKQKTTKDFTEVIFFIWKEMNAP
jgi:hypothetical protein